MLNPRRWIKCLLNWARQVDVLLVLWAPRRPQGRIPSWRNKYAIAVPGIRFDSALRWLVSFSKSQFQKGR